MIGQFVITLREGFEATLLVAVLVAYLRRSNRIDEIRYAYIGSLIALFSGIVAAFFILTLFGGLKGTQKEIFESLASYLAVAVLTYMILWMAGERIKEEIESRAKRKFAWGIATIAFIFVVREVIETILFLTPFVSRDAFGTLLGGLAGLASAILLSIAIFRIEFRISIRKFFYVTSIFLAFIASGILGYGTHELVEVAEGYGYESWLFEKAYDLGFTSENPLHHKGMVGGIFSVIFGYSASMEWLRVFLQFSYLLIMLVLIFRKYK